MVNVPCSISWRGKRIHFSFQVPSEIEEWKVLTGLEPMEVLNKPVVRAMKRQLMRKLKELNVSGEAGEAMVRKLAEELPVPYLKVHGTFWERLARKASPEVIAFLEKRLQRPLKTPEEVAEALKKVWAASTEKVCI